MYIIFQFVNAQGGTKNLSMDKKQPQEGERQFAYLSTRQRPGLGLMKVEIVSMAAVKPETHN
jgi:hypothetical protein